MPRLVERSHRQAFVIVSCWLGVVLVGLSGCDESGSNEQGYLLTHER